MINGRTFGPKDGLVIETGEFAVTPGSGVTNVVTFGGPLGSARPDTTYNIGTSYASTNESVQFFYTGKAYAAANLYGGKRVVQVCFRYTRDGKSLGSGKVCSNANSSTGRWLAGRVAQETVEDTLNPFASKTMFTYSKALIDPGVL